MTNMIERQQLIIVCALGVYRNRLAQKKRWTERKRLKTLRSQLADCYTIDDVEEGNNISKAIKNCKNLIRRRENLIKEVETILNGIKEESGITDEMKVLAEE